MFCTTVFAALLQAGITYAGVKLPVEPVDKTTPVQQRLSFQGPNGEKTRVVPTNGFTKLSRQPSLLRGTRTKCWTSHVYNMELTGIYLRQRVLNPL